MAINRNKTVYNLKFSNIQKIASVDQMITPDEARIWRDTKHFERQRNISPANVERLAHEMEIGRFTQGTQIYA